MTEFLRRVRELALARGANKQDLFNSACDLFAGSALKWFRAGLANRSFLNWDEVEAQLMIDYESYDYGDNLLEYIKGRIQKPSERIVTYFAIMEDLFLKLNRPVLDDIKANIIRRNLRPEFIKSLGFTRTDSIHELKQHCRLIENDLHRLSTRESSREYQNRNRNVRFSDQIDSLYSSSKSLNHFEEESEPSRMTTGTHFSSGPSKGYQGQANTGNPSAPSRSLSPNGRNAEFIDQRMKELSVGQGSNLHHFNVPPPPAAHSSPRGGTDQVRPKQYFAPHRSLHSLESEYENNEETTSGNDHERLTLRTSVAPLLVRRPNQSSDI